MSLESFERYPLLLGPSPIQPLPRLTKHLGGATIWAKREDLNSGLAFGGNKTRKLEYLVADALAQGCDTLVSIERRASRILQSATASSRSSIGWCGDDRGAPSGPGGRPVARPDAPRTARQHRDRGRPRLQGEGQCE